MELKRKRKKKGEGARDERDRDLIRYPIQQDHKWGWGSLLAGAAFVGLLYGLVLYAAYGIIPAVQERNKAIKRAERFFGDKLPPLVDSEIEEFKEYMGVETLDGKVYEEFNKKCDEMGMPDYRDRASRLD